MAEFKQRVRQTVIDLETYGKGPYAAIASIGIVDFFVSDEFVIEDQYYANVHQDMNKKLNREYDDDTIDWWLQQDPTIRKALLVDQKPLDVVMREVIAFIDKKALIWCQGTDFDISILKTTFKQLELEIPWKYSNVRDSRTFTEELGYSMKRFRDPSSHHNALDDAICQAKVVNMLKRMIENGMKDDVQ
mgnify:CR=1 FL=1